MTLLEESKQRRGEPEEFHLRSCRQRMSHLRDRVQAGDRRHDCQKDELARSFVADAQPRLHSAVSLGCRAGDDLEMQPPTQDACVIEWVH